MAEVASEDLHGATPSPLFKEHMAAFLDGRNPTDYNPTRCTNWWRFNNGEVTWTNNDWNNHKSWCVGPISDVHVHVPHWHQVAQPLRCLPHGASVAR
jgi:hypothetical protein